MQFAEIDAIGKKYQIECIENIDAIFYQFYATHRSRFTLGMGKRLCKTCDPDYFEMVLKDLVEQGFIEICYEICCTECGEILKKYPYGKVMSASHLIGDSVMCQTCNTKFKAKEENIDIIYAFSKELKPILLK